MNQASSSRPARPRSWLSREIIWQLGGLAKRRGRASVGGCQFDVADPSIDRITAGVLMRGEFERPERQAIARFLDPELPVIECGGSMGIVSCITNKRLRRPADHLVVECNPDLIPRLQRNRDLNGCAFEIVEAAIAYGRSTVTFVRGDVVSGRVSYAEGHHTVPALTLEAVASKRTWPTWTLVCDIEGAERELFEREIDLIAQHARCIILETHRDDRGVDTLDAIASALTEHRFRRVSSSGDVHVFQAA